jgi:putative transposase
VDRWYASSKTCSACGWVDEDVSLADRTFVCVECGLIIERDLNAAINIRKEALRLRTDVPVVASSGHKFACGAGSAGSLCGESETFCDEAGTTML